MKISVIVRTCSRPDFLEQALASVQLQTHTDWEVIVFDDGDNSKNQRVVNEFKLRVPLNKVTYINSGGSYHLFKESWKIAPKISEGEVMIRLDDDDILDSNTLSFVSEVFTQTPDLDFAYGTSVLFRGDDVFEMMPTQTPLDIPKTKDIWEGYIEEPWNIPWRFKKNYYDEPHHITSIIHASKMNEMCVFHPYMMRTSSVLRVVDKITMTSNFVDDLEFLASLDYLGLGFNSLNKILTYVRKHDEGSITDGRTINGVTLWNDIYRVREKVDMELRPTGLDFLSKVVEVNIDSNSNNGVDVDIKNRFKLLLSDIKSTLTPPTKTFHDRFDWRRF
jgi:glycosyltransferase involved in cell wall biosynthesis